MKFAEITCDKLLYLLFNKENILNKVKLIRPPYSRQLKENYFTVYYEGDFFMGKISRALSIDFKMKAIEIKTKAA
ncbi:hypothetical protein P4388_01190 [Bacillus thuringiensis]|uniref:hypothetical protein n=1 Tax=Bacillus thuringiensis TaxID=1428 RepID=UPI000A371A8E|nr:hypothetical protein [Bacillus thuringiensis]MED3347296.1 hypothetical protein [Bacillus thuringiensis]OTW89960.1 hypothetical protein BK711_31690 [Bacillus thuringiensis serovar fukuokaensis]OTW93430.1 hypothetical protein BK710_01405 [Bacillus thuringiensis serovar sumiyoshiensis]PEB13920.1 hypothetical protein COM67_04200 [Bacillus thuringiensis]PEB68618.1 hypothetical protein COM91_17800 [Bacillus thuringiensis]